MPQSRKLENFKNAIAEQTKKQSELEQLRIENIQLKAKNETLENENQLLKAQLQLIYQEKNNSL